MLRTRAHTRLNLRIGAMLTAVLAVGLGLMGLSNFMAYDALWEERTRDLMHSVEIVASLLISVAEHDQIYSTHYEGGALSGTLHQFQRGLRAVTPAQGHGRFTVGRREGDRIQFIFNEDIARGEGPTSVPWDSPLAEPMRRALQGGSGLVQARDYRGVEVYAAYRALPQLGLGVVSKIEVDELLGPFWAHLLLELGLAVVVLVAGVGLTLAIARPIVHELEHNEARFRSYFEQGLTGIAEISPDGHWMRVNHELCRMLGYSPEELRSLTWSELTHPKDLPAEGERFRMLETGQLDSYTLEKRFIHRDGRPVHALISVRAIPFRGAAMDYAVATALDVTERVRTEALARQSQRLEILGNLVAGLAHEINNPLMGLANYIEDARRRGDDPDQARSLEKAETQVERIARLVQNTLSLSRPGTQAPEPVHLSAVLAEALELVGPDLRAKGIELSRPGVPEDLRVMASRDGLQQILINLLINARDALSEAGRQGLDLGLIEQGGKVVLIFDDEGVGVPEALCERIFEPFFTTKPAGKGTGMGLAVSRQLARSFGGDLRLGEPGSGARFELILVRARGTG